MGVTAAVAVALTAAKTTVDYVGARKAGKAARKQGEFNATQAEQQAADALARGEETAAQTGSAARQLTGAQRASLASQGIDISSGSAADVISNDQALSKLDEIQIRRNAQREAHGFQVEAQGYRMAGVNQARAYNSQATGTLIGGAADLFNIYNAYGRNTSSTPRASSSGRQGTSGGQYSGKASR